MLELGLLSPPRRGGRGSARARPAAPCGRLRVLPQRRARARRGGVLPDGDEPVEPWP